MFRIFLYGAVKTEASSNTILYPRLTGIVSQPSINRCLNFLPPNSGTPKFDDDKTQCVREVHHSHFAIVLQKYYLEVRISDGFVMQAKAQITVCKHLETFDPGTAYTFKCDLLVSVMPHDTDRLNDVLKAVEYIMQVRQAIFSIFGAATVVAVEQLAKEIIHNLKINELKFN